MCLVTQWLSEVAICGGAKHKSPWCLPLLVAVERLSKESVWVEAEGPAQEKEGGRGPWWQAVVAFPLRPQPTTDAAGDSGTSLPTG